MKKKSDFIAYPHDKVTIVFRNITVEPTRTIAETISLDTVKEITQGKVPDEIVQYYKIESNAKCEGPILIFIFSNQARLGQLWSWERKGEPWIDRTLCSMKVGEYTVIVGKTRHLSPFGIR